MSYIISRDDSSAYTYETIYDVENEDNAAYERAEDMVGVEVFTVEEEDEDEDVEVDNTRHDTGGLSEEGLPYMEELGNYLNQVSGTFESQVSGEGNLQSPTSYYDATSPSAFSEEVHSRFFQGDFKRPVVEGDGYYDEVENGRDAKIRALDGFGWQTYGPVEEDDDDL